MTLKKRENSDDKKILVSKCHVFQDVYVWVQIPYNYKVVTGKKKTTSLNKKRPLFFRSKTSRNIHKNRPETETDQRTFFLKSFHAHKPDTFPIYRNV